MNQEFVGLDPDQVSAVETAKDVSARSVERRRDSRRKRLSGKTLPINAESTDRVIRLILALGRKPGQGPVSKADDKETGGRTDPDPDIGKLNDLVHAHCIGAASFGRDFEDVSKLQQQILSHTALEPLEEAAKFVAATSVFLAHAAHRLKTSGKYWVLDGLGEAYPYPVGIRTGTFPSWKGQIRSLEKLQTRLRQSSRRALKLEAATLVAHHPEMMPAELIFDAETAVRKAIACMQAFPVPLKLRSRYRRIVRPNAATESVRVVAYVLDRLFREHTGDSAMKVKEIECRIAEVETTFLGQNIQYDPDFGCPAVRLQIRSVKGSRLRTRVDSSLAANFEMVKSKLRERDPGERAAVLQRLGKRLDRHGKAYDRWSAQVTSKLDQDLRNTLEPATYMDEAVQAMEQWSHPMRNHLDLRHRWIDEYNQHLSVLQSGSTNVFQYSQVVRKWVNRWESLFDFPM
jgi:hypothetical protein